MKRAVIVSENCLNCVPCPVESNCSNHAIIREEPTDKPWVDFYMCSGCLKCKALCGQSDTGNNKAMRRQSA
ncbi:MAG: hypothetical protein WCP73_04555 [Eubacteriales bacterium]